MDTAAAATSQERAYAWLRDHILSLDLKPNMALRTQVIAEEIGLSRTPVREALGRLEQAGLVARDGGWGYRVRAITYKEAMDVYRVREALEVEAVTEALPLLKASSLDDMRRCLEGAEEKLRQRRLKEFRNNTRRFHRSIALATDNTFLISMLMTIEDRIHLLGAMMAKYQGEHPQQSIRENFALLSALERRDEEGAVSAVRQHVASAREVIARSMMVESSR
jgi:DNA-binding GntR family transcriptional regulator